MLHWVSLSVLVGLPIQAPALTPVVEVTDTQRALLSSPASGQATSFVLGLIRQPSSSTFDLAGGGSTKVEF